MSTLPVAAWDGFESELRALWPERVDERGFPDAFLEGWLDRVRRDAFGFAAAEAARRVVGLAHVADLETLEPDARAAASRGVIATVRAAAARARHARQRGGGRRGRRRGDREGGMTDDLRAAVAWTGDAVEIIDQTRLPAEELVLRLTTPEEVVEAIARLAVRGAPAIGICGAFGVVLAADQLGRGGDRGAPDRDRRGGARRPADGRQPRLGGRPRARRARRAPDAAALRGAVEAEAIAILAEDREACRLIGEHGRAELPRASRLLTLCNTGRLATGGWGTALGVVYAKAAAGEQIEVLACETRPLLQGARLTAWELQHAGIPVTVMTEGAAAARLARGDVDAVIVGADRVAANGDTANKIGTYALAIAAHHHGDPVLRRRAALDARRRDGRRRRDRHRAARGLRGPHRRRAARRRRGLEPRLRRHPRRARHRDHLRRRRAAPALRRRRSPTRSATPTAA